LDANSPKIIDAVNRAHSYLLDLFDNSVSVDYNVSIADDCDDIFLWVREDGMTPSPRPDNITDDIEVYETNWTNLLGLNFQLFVDGNSSDYTVECEYSLDTSHVLVEDLHVL
jgi:hypothetical protein